MTQPPAPTATPWGASYPWDPGGHWPWQTPPPDQPATPAPPPDTSLRDSIVKQLGDAHGGYTEGTASTVYNKPTAAQTAALDKAVAAAGSDTDKQKLKDDFQKNLDSNFDLYTFGDGTTVELSQDGQQRNYKPAPAADQKLNQAQAVTANTTDPKIVMRDPKDPTNLITTDNPNYKPPTPQAVTANTTDPKIVMRDPSDPSNIVTVDNPNYVPPKPTAVTANTTDANIVTRDASGNLTTTPNPNYVAPKPTSVTANTTDPYLVTRDASGNLTNTPNPNYQKPAAAPITTNTTDPYITLRDPKSGQITTVANPNYSAGGTVVGTPGSTEQNILTRDPRTGTITAQPNPNYVAPKPTQITPSTTAPYITTQDAKGNLTSVPNPSYVPTDPGRMTAQLNQQAMDQHNKLNAQVANGSLSPEDASSQFNQWWDANIEPVKGDIAAAQAKAQAGLAYTQSQTAYEQGLTAMLPADLAQKAADAAQGRAVSMMPYMVNQSAATSPGITRGAGGWPTVNPQQVMQNATYSLPNLQEIGRIGAAQALAQISPTAQMHLQTPGPLGQPAAPGMPDINSLLNQGSYNGFGGAPGGGTPPAGLQPMPAPAPGVGQTSYQIPGLNLGGMPGTGYGGAQSVQMPYTNPGLDLSGMPGYGPGGQSTQLPGAYLGDLWGQYQPTPV